MNRLSDAFRSTGVVQTRLARLAGAKKEVPDAVSAFRFIRAD